MSIARYIKTIGRGSQGARSLSAQDAHDLMSQVLDVRVTDLEIGAFAIAMRIKGETVPELAGFLAAAHERCIAVGRGASAAAHPAAWPTLVLPSYNGSRRMANLTPLLALLLAKRGVNVLVHGPRSDATRVTTADIFQALGLAPADDASAVEAAWRRREPAFMQTEILCPPLARLLAVRDVVGLRNPAHTIAKLLGIGTATEECRAFRVVNFTHPEYGLRLAEFMAATGADAMLMRGTEGEPVADARRLQRLDVFIAGALQADLSVAGRSGTTTETPVLPERDASATAAWTRSVIHGDGDGGGDSAVPGPLSAQIECLMHALDAMKTADAGRATP